MPYNDAFCYYCQKEYKSHKNLVKHIKTQHPGTYAYNACVKKGEIDAEA